MTRETSRLMVERDPIFKDFCQNRELSPNTVRLYRIGLQKYVDFTGKSLTELLEEAEYEEAENIIFRKRKLNQYLNGFKFLLNELSISDSYKSLLMVQIKAFYNEYEIQLPRPKKRKSSRNNLQKTIASIPTKEEIIKFLERANDVYKAVIIMGLSSGMGISEICSITFKHLYDAIEIELYTGTIPEIIDKLKDKEDFIPRWDIIRVKTGKQYFTFSSHESIEYIINYLDTLHFKHGLYEPKPENKLFRSLKTCEELKPYNAQLVFNLINRSYGFRKENGRYVIRSHGLRKYFATTCEKNKVPHLSTKWLLGHTISGTDSSYFFADPNAVKKDYMEVLPYLSVKDTETRTIYSPEYLELKEKYERDSKVKDKEMAEMRKKMELMDDMLKELMEKQLNNKIS